MIVLSPSAHVGSGNHGDMVMIHHGKRHYDYAFILEKLMLFSIRVSKSLDPNQERYSVGPDLGPNCLQRLSVDDKSRR